jgi:hypothetical protein
MQVEKLFLRTRSAVTICCPLSARGGGKGGISLRYTTHFSSPCFRLSSFKTFSSSSSDGKKKESEKEEGPGSFLTKHRTHLTQAAIAGNPPSFSSRSHLPSLTGGIGVTLYGLSSFMWDLTYGLMSMTPFQSGYYGFITGCMTTTTLCGLAYYAKRSAFILPKGVQQKALSLLNSHADVRIAMGGYVTSNDLIACRSEYGRWTISSWKPVWVPAKVEMIFKINFQKTEGLATVVATQQGLHSQIEFMGVDVFNADALRILVKGEGHGFSVHETLRANVIFN